MALLHIDGFDLYTAAADLYTLEYAGNFMSFSTSAGRFSGGAAQTTAVGSIVKTGVFPLELWSGFAFQSSDTRNSDCPLILFVSSGGTDSGVEGSVTINCSTNQLRVWRGFASTLLGSAAVTICDGGWHWLDFHFKYDATGGVMEVWIDGVQVINVTGANTQRNSGQSNLVSVNLGSYSVNTATANIDDWVISDTTGSTNNGRVTDSRVETLTPVSDATPNDGTLSSGSNHYAMVNEAHWDTTSTTTMTNTSGQEELFGIGSLSSTPVSISGVQITYVAENTDAGAASLETTISSSASTASGSSTALTSSWQRNADIYEQDPHTSAAWVGSAVNALKVGFKVP